ncbi:ectomycorrhiza-induced ankyrin-domain/NACHT-domain containing protein [Laccaria bicolor S238N-H82]|uniref:Ectomycorrhiza-induced ankyrin-domain/NACHT-domain containing protein n=1 Tax=Laccaria bicolor (strain S238N-H82 / ATCC MYA-4686) TaxID=486041 RepID=B0DSJ3_LACBS|nr:ectomycorrhiza-induced ankyrin-domain/NACHT-domain containing protein [Laccaria bicolor S238N-H82]EDR02559.1 ectomycorrhiza-induced ankyrin-domain/NACHT-domain containing protein [Laccaria bicolor S238N-H82]|eukprot:XP_001886922.1 ectomycorrhiza-induced ankyrin-domain/NACHT-domain containing protein [Laccaria bicolor S238N-H82]
MNIARPSCAPLIMMTQSSTILVSDMVMPVTSDPFEVPAAGEIECSQQVLPNPTDFLSSDLPTSPPIASVLGVGLMDSEMTAAFGQAEGPVQGAVDISSPTLTGPPSFDLPISVPIPSALNVEMMPARFSTNIQADTINNISAKNLMTGDNYGTINQGVDPDLRITLEMIKNEQLAKEIYKWLSPSKESLNYNAAYAITESQPNTCQWFLKGKTFSGWLKQPGFLWIKGKSGSGKTILSSAIIHNVLQRFNSATAYFFFDGRDLQKDFQLHDKLMRSLIWQFSLKCGDRVPKVLVDLYACCGNGHQEPTLENLQNTLGMILGGFSSTFIILDALDECTEREKLLNWIQTIILENPGLHFIVTSRPEQEIEDKLKSYHYLDLAEESENHELEAYLDYQLDNDSNLQKWNSDTQKQIKLTLMKQANGMFRWVALQLNELKECRTKTDLKKQLADLPQGLDKTYDRILLGINKRDLGYAKIFLQWLCFAVRPVTLEELATTAAVDLAAENEPEYKPDNELQDIKDVLKICSSFIMKSGRFIKLSHFSVKEYLISQYLQNHAIKEVRDFSFNKELSHSVISQICLAYLLQFHTSEPLSRTVNISSPLAKYAAENWILHTHHSGKNKSQSSPVFVLAMKLLTDENAAFLNWVRLCDVDCYNHMKLEKQKSEIAKPLYYASLTGLTEESYALLEMGADINACGGRYGNALQAASDRGHEEITKLLIEKGADVNAHGGVHGSALHAALYHGNEAIARLLIEKGADVNAQEREYGTVLHAALHRGYEAIAKLLIEKGADVNAQDGEHGTALHAASYTGHEAIAKLLTEKGADVNAQNGGYYGNALHAALYKGYEAIAKLLIQKGANVNAQGGCYGTADREGSRHKCTGWGYGTVLHAASYAGYEAIAKLLIEKGADVNAQNGEHGNALHAALYKGYEAIAKLLIQKGANVNAQGGYYGNALYAASYTGHEAIAKLLIEKGADVNAQGGCYGSALYAASYIGHEAIAKLLIENGADVNAWNREHGTALHAASYAGHEAIAKLLIQKGADVNAQGGCYGNALQAASDKGNEAIAKLLIEKGADESPSHS